MELDANRLAAWLNGPASSDRTNVLQLVEALKALPAAKHSKNPLLHPLQSKVDACCRRYKACKSFFQTNGKLQSSWALIGDNKVRADEWEAVLTIEELVECGRFDGLRRCPKANCGEWMFGRSDRKSCTKCRQRKHEKKKDRRTYKHWNYACTRSKEWAMVAVKPTREEWDEYIVRHGAEPTAEQWLKRRKK